MVKYYLILFYNINFLISVTPDNTITSTINVIPKYRSGDFPGENIISYMNLPIENSERIASKCVWQDIKEVHLISEED